MLYPGFCRSSADLLAVASRHIKTGDVVWDIGSNQGIFAFCAAGRTGPTGRVFTVEADPKYADLQNRTIASLPKGYAPVKTLCAAVADRAGVLELSIPKNGHARNHLSIVAGNDAAAVESTKAVTAVTLDWLLDHWSAPDFVKIDVEGAEMLVLKGASELLRVHRPNLYIEVSEANQAEATKLLRSHGYRFYKLTNNGSIAPTESCCFETVAL